MRLRRLAGAIAVGTTILSGGLPALPAAATDLPATLYVDHNNQDCTDAGPGSDSLTPLCTVAAATALAQPGQTVLIGGDTPYREQLAITRSGKPGLPITFAGVGGEAYFGGIEAQGLDQPAVTLTGVHDVVVRDLYASASGEPFLVKDSNQVTLEHNSAIQRGGDGPLAGIRLTGSTTGAVVRRNSVGATRGPGIQLDAGVSGTTVTTNGLRANHGGVIASGAPGTVVTSNTIAGGCAPEVSLGDGSAGATVENNVLAHTTGGLPWGSCAADQVPADLSVTAGAASGTKADYNAVHSTNPYNWAGTAYADATALLAGTGQGGHDLNADLKMDGNGVLQPGSPAIDSADPNAPGELATDRIGVPAVDDPVAPNGASTRDRGDSERQGIVTGGLGYGSTPVGAAPLTVEITAQVSELWPGGTLSYSYDFGDGTPALVTTSQQVSHVYQATGVFVPVVTASDNFGSKYRVLADSPVKVSPPGPPHATLSYQDDTAYTAPLSYDFDTSRSGGPWRITKRVIDFGDGTPAHECPANPTGNYGATCVHTYAKPGVYQAKLTVTDSTGATASSTVAVTAAYRPGLLTTDHPQRVLDTRNGTGAPAGRLGPGQELTLNLSGPSNTPYNPPITDRNATAAVLNLTAVNPDAGSYLTVYPSGQERPTTSNSNFVPGQTVAHLVTVPIGADGTVKIYNRYGTVNVVADLVAFYTPQHVDSSTAETLAGFTALPPTRILDTRNGTGTGHAAPAGPQGQVCVPVPASAATARSLVLNLTATGSDQGGYLTNNAPGQTPWSTSLLNFKPQETVANQVILPVTNGQACVANFVGHTHVVADLTGFYGTAGDHFKPVPPARLLDTRAGSPIGQDATRVLPVAGRAGVPADATGAVLDLTAVDASFGGYLTAYPTGASRPGTSSVNFTAKQVVPNHLTTGLGTDGSISLYNRFGTTDTVADVFGYFTNTAK
ncbi:PKD domain-containing protein [Kitasatospora sp. NPDC002227]|uniref:PKD domain-containing protein n=1 Tax=Kitasatospora sp. NPDC002227 TaxID=3154773 RepID=UPI003326C863